MEIKIKIKRPGKGTVYVDFSCNAEETAQLIKATKKHDKRLAGKKEKKNNDM